MNTTRLLASAALAVAVALPAPASANEDPPGGGGSSTVTDPSEYLNALVVDFEQFALGGDWDFLASADVGTSVGEAIFASVMNQWGTFTIGDGFYGLNGPDPALDNGGWEFKSSIALDDASGWVQFDFQDGPVAGVGGFFNYAGGFPDLPFIEALDAVGNVLATIALDIQTGASSVNQGAFYGFWFGSATIHSLRMNNSYIIMDDLTFTRTVNPNPPGGPGEVIPEPITLVLLGSGLAGVGAVRRRRPRLEPA